MSFLQKIVQWLKLHPTIFRFQEEGKDLILLENFSQKQRKLQADEISQVEVRKNTLTPDEDYLIILLTSGQQLVLARQGFVFAPNFTNTGPLSLPSQVYCLQDFVDLLGKLKHLAAEADRQREALDLIMILIAILDGARAVGLEVGQEEREVEDILEKLEKGQILPKPHGTA